MEDSRKLIAVSEWPLRASPHGEFSIRPLGHGGPRLERSMRDVRAVISGVEPVCRAGQPVFHGTFLLAEAVLGFGGGGLLVVNKKFLIGNLRSLFPLRFHAV